MLKRLSKKKYIFSVVILITILIVIFGVPKIFASLQPIKSVEIFSEKLNYKEKEPGAWKITKSAKWLSEGEAEITIDLDSILKVEEKYTDMIFVLDTSGSMEGERLESLKSTTTSLTEKLLKDNNNRVALITFDQGSNIASEFTNEKDVFIDKVNSLTAQWVTNYYLALVNVDKIMKNYVKEDNRECVVVFLTDGYPNYDTPNEVGQYNYLKKTYPYLLINAIQYEMGDVVTNEVKRISDNQFIANVQNLESILNEASIVPALYEYFKIEDYIDTNYFHVESIKDIESNFGSVSFDKEAQKISWNIDKFRTGSSAELTIRIKVKENTEEEIFPTNNILKVNSSLDKTLEDINSKLTPVLKGKYDVIYDVNAPSDCRGVVGPENEKRSVFETVGVSSEEPKCEGYQFKGWKYIGSSAKRINDDYFIMPEEDVNIKGTWSRLDISKSMDGTVKDSLTLYKQVQEDFSDPNKFVKKYTGDTSTFNGNEDVYYYYGEAKNNNVLFANYCWKIVRTTDTGGVKLLYNGVPSNDLRCDNIGTDSILTGEQMNRASNAIPFNNRGSVISQGAYTYNGDYSYKFINVPLEKDKQIINVQSIQTSSNYYYSKTYSYRENQYILDSPVSYSWVDSFSELVGMYTCRSTSSNGICKNLSYIIAADVDKMIYINLTEGKSINDDGFEPTMMYSSTFERASDGSYILKDPLIINKSDWNSNHAKYRLYYTCGTDEVKCNDMLYIKGTNNSSMTYLVVDDKIKYGNSFEWDGTTYTLKDTIDMWDSVDIPNLKNHHYTCFNKSGQCREGELFYLISQFPWTKTNLYYTSIENGISIDMMVNELFYSEKANKSPSLVKEAIDYWYTNYMTDWTRYLEDTVWCVDRDIEDIENSGLNPNGGSISGFRFSSGVGRDNTLSCRNINDRFTVSKDYGNGALDYPVGMITKQEAQMAYENGNSPLALINPTYLAFWLITPLDYRNDIVSSLFVKNDGSISSTATGVGDSYIAKVGLRPSISLKADIEYIQGDGSANYPYIIFNE